ncbi:MAG: DUF6599 family protein [Planctomycetota bacterium]|jgi:hypothetical protein
MSATPGRAKRLESAISISLLAVLFLIGLGVCLKQRNSDISRFGIDTASAQQSAQDSPSGLDEDCALAPLAPPGFGAPSQTETYTAENLYEKINGKADFYIDAGFEQLSTQRFISSDNETLWLELYVYDMGNIRNAFSVYSRQRRPEVPPLPDVQFGYSTANSLYFVHGKYYIELVASAESQELRAAAIELTQKVRTDLAIEQRTEIAELGLFPAENLVPDSFRLYPSDTFGFERLTNTFAARYEIDGEIVTAFFSQRPDAQDAKNIARAYHGFLLDSGCFDKTTTNQTLADLKADVVDAYGTTEIIFVTGPFVAGVHEADNQQAAEKLAEVFALKLSGIEEEKGD